MGGINTTFLETTVCWKTVRDERQVLVAVEVNAFDDVILRLAVIGEALPTTPPHVRMTLSATQARAIAEALGRAANFQDLLSAGERDGA